MKWGFEVLWLSRDEVIQGCIHHLGHAHYSSHSLSALRPQRVSRGRRTGLVRGEISFIDAFVPVVTPARSG